MPLFSSGGLGLGLKNLVLFTSLAHISTCPSLVTRLQHSASNLAPIRKFIPIIFFLAFNDVSSYVIPVHTEAAVVEEL